MASTEGSSTEIDMTEGLKLDVETIVDMTNRAISEPSATVENEPGPAALVRDDPDLDAGV